MRKTKQPENCRTLVIEVNVTPAEKLAITAAAASQSLATGAFMRQAGMHFVKKLASK